MFDEHGLESLIGGMTDIDMDDWTYFTCYRRYEKAGRVIERVWACFRSPMERSVRITTGTSCVPVNSNVFKDLQGSDGPRRFMIEKSGDPWVAEEQYFNRLDFLPYEDYESLEMKLCSAIECAFGFSAFFCGVGY